MLHNSLKYNKEVKFWEASLFASKAAKISLFCHNKNFSPLSQCLRSEKKFHFDFDFFHFYLIKSVIWQPPAMHPGDWPE